MDGGSNCQILIREEHFIYLIRKPISCSLANGAKSKFHGIGVAVANLQGTPMLLAPCYYSKTDGCSEANHSALKHLSINKDGRLTSIPVETVAGLDYIKAHIHHFKGPLQTKISRNSFLTIKPPKFILNSGHYVSTPKKCNKRSSNLNNVVMPEKSKANDNIPTPQPAHRVSS